MPNKGKPQPPATPGQPPKANPPSTPKPATGKPAPKKGSH